MRRLGGIVEDLVGCIPYTIVLFKYAGTVAKISAQKLNPNTIKGEGSILGVRRHFWSHPHLISAEDNRLTLFGKAHLNLNLDLLLAYYIVSADINYKVIGRFQNLDGIAVRNGPGNICCQK